MYMILHDTNDTEVTCKYTGEYRKIEPQGSTTDIIYTANTW